MADKSNDRFRLAFALADFDVDVRSGFLSPSAPLTRITDPVYQPWEDALETICKSISQTTDPAERLIQVDKWRKFISCELPTLEIDPLIHDIVEMRRAHLVLAFLTHAFVHSLSSNSSSSLLQAQTLIPLSLAVPFTAISLALDMPPVLTYADTVLYNWSFKEPKLGFIAENLEITTTFTQTDSERHFYKTSVLVEALGPECLRLMRSSLDEAFMEDETSIKRIGNNLGRLAKQIDRISNVLSGVRAGCDPRTFYWEIRPWFIAGRWRWEGVDRCDESEDEADGSVEGHQWKVTEFGGPSAGQSTLIHAIDVFLGVNHEPTREEISSGIQDEETFMKRMSTYMPHHHRLFLDQLSRSCLTNPGQANLIRSIVINHQDQPFKSGPNNLKENYNSCIQSLENLRKTHTQIVSLFIICQKNSSPSIHSLASAFASISVETIHPTSIQAEKHVQPDESLDKKLKDRTYRKEKTNEQESPTNLLEQHPADNHTSPAKAPVETLATSAQGQTEVLKGTGGTDLSKFLKRCKLRTTQAFLD